MAAAVLLVLGWNADGTLRDPLHAVEGVERVTVDRVAVGRVCRSDLDPGMELSCGTEGFGDLRHVCRVHEGETRCTRTTAVAVRNSGRSGLFASVISGPRQGVREQGADRMLAPGETITLRPQGSGYLFDITLRTSGPDPARIQIVRVQ